MGATMSIDYDPDHDTLYIRLREGVPWAYGRPLDDSRYVDFGADDQPIGIELLGVSKGVKTDGLPQAEMVAEILRRRHPAFA
jgi:uncharacterized protein YuzE